MAKLHRITLAGKTFHARSGQTLLDAALANGVDLPHDCKAGRCGACLTRVRAGITLGGQSHQAGLIHACQAMVFSHLEIEVEQLPPIQRVRGRIVNITEMAEEIVELTIKPARALTMLPGQYCRFTFRGFPERPFSPTAAMADAREDGLLRLHVKRVRGGRVTPHLGHTIKPGHAVSIEGPLGHAFLRPGRTGRLVLIGSGTGFAPVWAVAAAALRENAARQVVLVAASRRLSSFYMGPALNVVRAMPSVKSIGCVEELLRRTGPFVPGRATDQLPPLDAADIVYAAGAPKVVEVAGKAASAAGAAFHADPFVVANEDPPGGLAQSLVERARAWLDAG